MYMYVRVCGFSTLSTINTHGAAPLELSGASRPLKRHQKLRGYGDGRGVIFISMRRFFALVLYRLSRLSCADQKKLNGTFVLQSSACSRIERGEINSVLCFLASDRYFLRGNGEMN